MANHHSSAKGDYGSLIPTHYEPPPPAASTLGSSTVDLVHPSLKTALLAEFFGTAILVQVGCGGLCVALYLKNMSGMFQIGAVWALGATIAIYLTASASGGHLNPAVTLSFALARTDDFSFGRILPYWLAQLAGAVVAAMVNLTIFHVAIARFEKKHGILRGITEDSIKSAAAFGDYWSLSKNVSGPFHAFFLEAMGTALLCFVIFAVTHPKNPLPSVGVAPVVGATIGIIMTLLGGLTGTGINPARDFGPRLVTLMAGWGGTASMTNSVVYLVGPLVGGPVGAFVADKILMID